MQQWLVMNKKADFKALGEKFQIDQVTARIIRNRDIIEEKDIQEFLYGNLLNLENPHLLLDGDKLVDILDMKIQQKRAIRIIGDYDIDGVMSTYILKTALERCGANVSIQIPDRIRDGYGLNLNLVEKAYLDGVDTILTCDNGIAAIDEIAYAKEKGLTVLVTDHHGIPYEEVNGEKVYKRSLADAIVNPQQIECSYPFKELCGAAVAWKVVCLLYEKRNIPKEETEDFLENVAFATVGDVMSLTGENRILVKEGLKRISHTKNIGMQALIAQCGIEGKDIESYHFGFVLGPCINATGRLDTAKRAVELFFSKNMEEAVNIARELVILNEERKSLTLEGIESAIAYCENGNVKEDKVLVVFLPDVHESIAGIIAGRIRERYNKPVFVLTKGEEGVKGSGRSIEEYSMYEELCKVQDILVKFGGHPMAAGVTLEEANVERFRKRLNQECQLQEIDFIPKIRIDVPMPMDYVTLDLAREFSLLIPYGKDNAKPIFADKGIGIKRMWKVGQLGNVLRLTFITTTGMTVQGIYFGNMDAFVTYLEEKFGKEQVEAAFRGKENILDISLIYFPKINSFRGEETLQFEMQYYK